MSHGSPASQKFEIGAGAVERIGWKRDYYLYVLLFECLHQDFKWYGLFNTESVKPTGKEKYYACPNPDEIIVLAGHETYHGRVGDPESFRLTYPSPVQQVYVRADAGIILLTSDRGQKRQDFERGT